jgi:hypothetical protein
MTNSTKRRVLGGAFVGAVILFFVLSLIAGGSGQMFIATSLFAHLPLFIVPFWVVLRAQSLSFRIVLRAVLCGWPAFLLSGILWEVCYRALYRRFHWGIPDLPGEIIAGIFLGWFPAIFITAAALVARLILDRLLPVSSHDSPVA